MNYVRGCINEIEAVRPEMPTVRENGCWTSTDNYIVCTFISRISIHHPSFSRVWRIDHGMCKQKSRSIVFVMNVMDAIAQYGR